MQPVDTFAIVGEVLSWIGLGVGIPLLVIGGMIALAEGHWKSVDIAVVERDDVLIARWFAGGDFHERPLLAREAIDTEWHRGFVSSRDPGYVRMHPPVFRRLILTLGTVFTAVGVIGFVVSLLPAFV